MRRVILCAMGILLLAVGVSVSFCFGCGKDDSNTKYPLLFGNAYSGAVQAIKKSLSMQQIEGQIPPEFLPERVTGRIELIFDSTLSNTYKRGNLDTWFSERTGDPDRQVDQGSPAFFGLGLAALFPNRTDTFQMGIGLGLILPPSHSLWGSQIYFGGRQELVLNPQIFCFFIPLKIQLIKGMYLSVSPAMLMGWVTGDYDDGFNYLEFTPSPTFGFGVSGALELYFMKSLGLSFKYGFRNLTTNLCYKDPTSETGYSQPVLANGDEVKPDLGGYYMTVGLILRLDFKKRSM